MRALTVEHMYKRFGSYTAVQDVSFQVEAGRLVGLLGPSGSGKTTLLRLIAGLETPDGGTITFGGQQVNDLPPQKRQIGFVFQQYALFKHMTVFENVAFGLKVLKKKKPFIESRVQELLEQTGLTDLGRRYPHELSGGQRQRVAFARAIAPEPKLLLLDEPFAAIDAKVRKELRTWLRDMINRIGITTLFVTHDQEEAIEVADELLILHQGKLEQQGTPQGIYSQPATEFVAGFIGESTRIKEPAAFLGFRETLNAASAIIRPEFVEVFTQQEMLSSSGISGTSGMDIGTVKNSYFRGTAWLIELEVQGQQLFAYRSQEKKELLKGDPVRVFIHRMYVRQGDKIAVLEHASKHNAEIAASV